MFICTRCLSAKYTNSESVLKFRSKGPCEECNEIRICNDIPNKYLVKKVPLDKKGDPLEGPYYAELDEGTNLFCVFHCDTGKAHASCSTMQQAEDRAKEFNEQYVAREDR